jgi:hypothetical protein
MKLPDKCCGRCALWERYTRLSRGSFGCCHWYPSKKMKLPRWVLRRMVDSYGDEPRKQTSNSNKDCQCFQPKGK